MKSKKKLCLDSSQRIKGLVYQAIAKFIVILMQEGTPFVLPEKEMALRDKLESDVKEHNGNFNQCLENHIVQGGNSELARYMCTQKSFVIRCVLAQFYSIQLCLSFFFYRYRIYLHEEVVVDVHKLFSHSNVNSEVQELQKKTTDLSLKWQWW
jgi:hypothetical protein